MKKGHAGLSGKVTSAFSYLDSVFKDDDDKALRDLEDLTKDIKDLGNKEDLSDGLDSISGSLRHIDGDTFDGRVLQVEEDIQVQTQDLVDKIDGYLGETSMPKEEDEYLEQIQKMIDSTIAIDGSGVPLVTKEVLATPQKEIDSDEIDKVFKEILAQEGYSSEPVDLTATEDDYLEALANELKESLEEDPVPIQEDIYTSINELYPYLGMNFIRSVYDFKEDIASSYPLATDVILLHRISFVVLDELRQFVEIVLDHGYRVNVDEYKMIVDVMKEFNNEDGKILANVFDIANQAKVLNGNYEGYHVEVL